MGAIGSQSNVGHGRSQNVQVHFINFFFLVDSDGNREITLEFNYVSEGYSFWWRGLASLKKSQIK